MAVFVLTLILSVRLDRLNISLELLEQRAVLRQSLVWLGMPTLDEVAVENLRTQPNVVCRALASVAARENTQPVVGCKVDSLCNIEAPVESRVIGTGHGDNELSFLLHHPGVKLEYL